MRDRRAATPRFGPGTLADHWDGIYRDRGPGGVSWAQAEPQPSLDLVRAHSKRDGAVIDVGGGASPLAVRLAAEGFADVTVLDVSEQALRESQQMAGARQRAIDWVRADVLEWEPPRLFRVWHDRAVFHFLTAPEERAAYLRTLRTALEPGGMVVLGTFAEDGPEQCSGLPVARYSADGLEEVLGDEFVPLEARGHRHRTPAGVVQPFTWLTARRR